MSLTHLSTSHPPIYGLLHKWWAPPTPPPLIFSRFSQISRQLDLRIVWPHVYSRLSAPSSSSGRFLWWFADLLLMKPFQQCELHFIVVCFCGDIYIYCTLLHRTYLFECYYWLVWNLKRNGFFLLFSKRSSINVALLIYSCTFHFGGIQSGFRGLFQWSPELVRMFLNYGSKDVCLLMATWWLVTSMFFVFFLVSVFYIVTTLPTVITEELYSRCRNRLAFHKLIISSGGPTWGDGRNMFVVLWCDGLPPI